MATEGPGREDRPDDADDIDARFEEIVSGLRAEQDATKAHLREQLRRANQQRRSANRPLEGFDNPNPWPPGSPRRPDASAPGTSSGGTSSPGTGRNTPGPVDGTNPPWSGPPTPRPDQRPGPSTPGPDQPAGGQPPIRPADRGSEPPRMPPAPPEPSWRGWEESDEEEHFVQPTPSLPAGDLHLWAIVIGLLGGPLLLVLSSMFHVLDSGWWTATGILLSVGGIVLLFLRLPKNRDYTDSSGGAQV
ncbi:hypothetical protein NF556_08515 [Ornithinimicrobium faecis]|uniref:DUF308 domain-containing protein n=1 Tax=Ornithinimicrobium faecis TaxID=2934158 RepID=A0ABY4YY42_9MICO|nr:hypothetical protein [Ornithinimicrobium sp. HY1793]USQ81674.1 hypothetical protein NF556_08515 [Ornithinimicrobium sp. HY1793]